MSNEVVRVVCKVELSDALDHFSACFGIRIAFFNPEWQEVVVGLQQHRCEYCKLIREELNGDELCRACDKVNIQIAREKSGFHPYVCHAGLNEAIKPLYIDNELIGYIMMGQFRTRERVKISTDKLDNYGVDYANKLQQAYSDITYIDSEKLPHIEGLFNILVESTLKNNYYRIEGNLKALRVKQYISENIARPVTISEVAEFLNCSVSTLSHTVKKQQGISFKEYVIESKLAVAFNYLKNSPDATVRVAALRVGYEDPYYFSRIFKKYYGLSPSKVIGHL